MGRRDYGLNSFVDVRHSVFLSLGCDSWHKQMIVLERPYGHSENFNLWTSWSRRRRSSVSVLEGMFQELSNGEEPHSDGLPMPIHCYYAMCPVSSTHQRAKVSFSLILQREASLFPLGSHP